MTKERLFQLSSVRREITRMKKRLAKIEDNGFKSSNSRAAAQKLKNALEEYEGVLYRLSEELLDYVKSIEDATVREIFMLRYFDGVRTWQKIAFLMGEYDESYVRKKHNAYLKKA